MHFEILASQEPGLVQSVPSVDCREHSSVVEPLPSNQLWISPPVQKKEKEY